MRAILLMIIMVVRFQALKMVNCPLASHCQQNNLMKETILQYTQSFGLVYVLWYINHCGLFNAKSIFIHYTYKQFYFNQFSLT